MNNLNDKTLLCQGLTTEIADPKATWQSKNNASATAVRCATNFKFSV
jgi:ATP-dependent phosphoenolpyruvate carboxykinase